MDCILPDYQNCGLNVVSSIMRYFGTPNPIAPHPAVDSLLRKHRFCNVVLMVFDGMGMHSVREFLKEDGFFLRHLLHELSAVYPSTTTNATTSLETGLAPKTHGWIGWTLYFDALPGFCDLFTNSYQGQSAADYPVAQTFLPRDEVFHRMNQQGDAKACCVSRYSPDQTIQTIDELFSRVVTLCNDTEKRYIYTYWHDPDHTMHEEGTKAPVIGQIIEDIQERVRTMMDQIQTDTLVLVTADHGLIDSRYVYLEDDPDLYGMLRRDPSVEPRAAALFVRPECMEQFDERFRQIHGKDFLLIRREDFIRDYLGPGEPNPMIGSLVGDYMALSVNETCLAAKRKDTHELVGVHAGLTVQEMTVPLIAVMKTADA